MLLALPFTLLLGSYVAAAPSIHHAQIRVDITDMDVQNHVDALHSSEELVMNQADLGVKTLPFNFTLSARLVRGSASLPFGFATSHTPDGFAMGELGLKTQFAFRNGRLITNDRALGYHVARIFPPWTSLWSLHNELSGRFIELIAVPQSSGGKPTHFLVFERDEHIFGAYDIEKGQPIFVAPQNFNGNRLVLAVEPIGESSDNNINANSAEQLL